jgi:hypothetical protein
MFAVWRSEPVRAGMSFERQVEPALAADNGAADLEQKIAAAGRSYLPRLVHAAEGHEARPRKLLTVPPIDQFHCNWPKMAFAGLAIKVILRKPEEKSLWQPAQKTALSSMNVGYLAETL